MRVVVAACLWVSSPAIADPPRGTSGDAARISESQPVHRHLVYAEALGKGGPYGIGWELSITPRLSIGAVGSFAIVRDHRLYTFAPYAHATIAGARRHALFGEAGLALVHSVMPSPVAEWDGMSETGVGGQAALGYEYRRGRVVGRAYLALAAGEGGIAPFGGLALGLRL